MTESETAGIHWQAFYDICERVYDNDYYFDDNEVDFAERMIARLNEYEENAYVSAAQANFIHQLDEQLERLGI